MAPAVNYNVGEYTQAWTDQALARRAVRYETRLETTMEGNRFFDLQKWGVQAEVLNDYLARESEFRIYLQGVQFTSPRNEFYPIPTHLSKYNVRRGQKVKRGDVIGYVGNTGRSVGPHLHYEILKDNKKINPLNFYYGNLSPKEFEAILSQSKQENQSMD